MRILNILINHKPGLYVCEIVNTLNLKQYNISKHLNILKMTELVEEEKQGKMVLYKANFVKENKELFTSVSAVEKYEHELFKKDMHNLQYVLAQRVNNECIITH